MGEKSKVDLSGQSWEMIPKVVSSLHIPVHTCVLTYIHNHLAGRDKSRHKGEELRTGSLHNLNIDADFYPETQ